VLLLRSGDSISNEVQIFVHALLSLLKCGSPDGVLTVSYHRNLCLVDNKKCTVRLSNTNCFRE
jgi:hypothetical protein